MTSDTQIAVRLDTVAVRQIDALVEEGSFNSRAAAVRHAVDMLLDARRRFAVGEQIAEGYRRQPQTEEEEAQALANLRALVAEEPW